jgi:hypothetical protein
MGEWIPQSVQNRLANREGWLTERYDLRTLRLEVSEAFSKIKLSLP